ncbi:unnamed protein product [Urochloa decumbens]|uniref:non-specific serine/threonine protein kinase n=1 Tax=Urochloa decumbens TaxID=240449 RepID=A0ABC8VK11_9POAL
MSPPDTWILTSHITLIFFSTAWAATKQTTNTEHKALLCIKSQLSQSNQTGALATWSNGSICQWQGVSCSRRHGPDPRVTSLDLEGEGLVGQISPCISNLTYLARIHLPFNQLSGLMPSELGLLGRLMYINLSSNGFNGGIPAALFRISLMQVFDLRGNNLSGEIPHLLPNTSSSLNFLGLTRNRLSGEIPSSLGNMSSLGSLLASQNDLTGTIPESLGRLVSLEHLDFTYNNLSGTVPNSIYNLSLLTYLGLGNNALVGKLPATLGNTLPKIQKLMMSVSNFEGGIPKSLANATNLVSVFMAQNNFSGVIPSLGSLPNLQGIMLFQNHRLQAGDWTFLSSLTNCTQLAMLNLRGNNLQGDLPSSVANLSRNLEYLILGSNKITGTIPSGIGNLVSLSMLYLNNNFLTGTIPATLGTLNNLFVLNLSKNRFYGDIPTSLGNLGQLSELYLQENNLSGTIPAELAGCKRLMALNLSSNTLDGPIPGQLFAELNQLSLLLDLSNNELTHKIPDEVGTLINLESLNISNNKITGQIPPTLGSCVLLQGLRLDGNFLEGRIPASFASLKGVKEMDFSRNNLSGEIPEFFELFNTLQYLNLSFNNLDGPIPTEGIFATASSSRLSLEGNRRLCTTSPMVQFPPCAAKVSEPKKRFVVRVLAILLPCVAISLLFLLFMKKRATRKDSHPIHETHVELKMLTYNDLSKATGGFSSENLIGSGQSCLVYKGTLCEEVDQLIAVKVFKLDQLGALNSFISECRALRNARHRNLAKVITACSTYDPLGNEFKALVLEYMANGTLDDHLHSHRYGYLSLSARISIAVDIASVLEYLHIWSVPPLVHCDLKPRNILFDDCNTAHVGDFGLARFLHGFCSSDGHPNSTSLIGARGSLGYIAPEYGMGCKISPEGDIYSYGIVLLELLTAKRPTDELFKDDLNLHSYVKAALPNIGEILDPALISQELGENRSHIQSPTHLDCSDARRCILQLLNLALLCSEDSPKDRPGIQDICSEVVAVKEYFLSCSH